MKAYSLPHFGAGITQLAECQLPKLNVAGSTPVARSILIPILLFLFAASVAASGFASASADWEGASGSNLGERVFEGVYPTVDQLENLVENGDRSAVIPLVWMLVRLGRTQAAEIWMEGRGLMVPVTRRDLGIALAWYGRFALYGVMSGGATVPDDLDGDDYGPTLAAVVAMGWMRTCPDGLFHPETFVGPADLEPLGSIFFGGDPGWDRSWISMSELDLLFHSGSFMGDE